VKSASNILLKLLGVLLLTGAALKGWQLLTEPMANNDIWSYRPFLILTVEFELALGIWLLSGLFKKAGWLATLSCFSLFSLITLYKGLSGAESCGCFGSVHVNPWITLFAIDVPAIVALVVFHPKELKLSHIMKPFKLLKPVPSMPRLSTIILIGFMVLSITTIILAFNGPSKSTFEYEVLELETWIGKRLPILEHIDISKQLERCSWVVVLYNYDCPDCVETIPKYKQMARDLAGNENLLQIALIEIPPYSTKIICEESSYNLGRLSDTKEWFIDTPTIVMLENNVVSTIWEGQSLYFDVIYNSIAMLTDYWADKRY